MNITKATIVGVLQDWDAYGNRFDIERIRYDVPLFLLDAFTDEEIESMVNDGYFGGDDEAPLGLLVGDIIIGKFFFPKSRWELEDSCELTLEIEEEK